MLPAPRAAHYVARHLSRRAYSRSAPLSRRNPTPSTTPPPPPPPPRHGRPQTLPPRSSPPSPTTPPPRQPSSGPPKTAWVIASLLAGGLGLYTVLLLNAAWQPCTNPSVALLTHQKDVAARYDATAAGFDGDVAVSEFVMGVSRLRKRLARQCHGHVLEASCGTGRNLGFFDLGSRWGGEGKVASLTLLDLSPAMVEVCKRKWTVLYGTQSLRADLAVRFVTGSALDAIPPPPAPAPSAPRTDDNAVAQPPPQKKYDTILQTMGLCSTPHPVDLIVNLASHLNTSNPNARILLLEHGRSYKYWLNGILDNSAEKHAELHGCWFNRDITALVEEAAARSGLEVKRERRHHLGTTYVFELGPKEGLEAVVQGSEGVVSNGAALKADGAVGAGGGDGGASSRGSWTNLLWSKKE